VETVLGTYLEAVCVDGIDAALGELAAGLDTGAVTLFDTRARPEAQGTGASPLPRISSKLQRGGYLDSLFPGVRAAESLSEALAQRQSLHAGESIITRDGVWIGASWLRVSRDEDPHAGVLAREQELRSVREAEDEQSRTVQALERRHTEAHASAESVEQERARHQDELNRAHGRYADVRARRDGLSARGVYLNRQIDLLGADESDLARQSDEVVTTLREAGERLGQAEGRARELEGARARA
jgi:chromosome segregation protein